MREIGGFVMNKVVITQNANPQKNMLEAKSVEAKVLETSTEKGLIIEENTIYEIDEECMNCQNKDNNNNNNNRI